MALAGSLGPQGLRALPVPLSWICPTARAQLGGDPVPCSPAPTSAPSLRGLCVLTGRSEAAAERRLRWGDPGQESVSQALGPCEGSKCSSRV